VEKKRGQYSEIVSNVCKGYPLRGGEKIKASLEGGIHLREGRVASSAAKKLCNRETAGISTYKSRDRSHNKMNGRMPQGKKGVPEGEMEANSPEGKPVERCGRDGRSPATKTYWGIIFDLMRVSPGKTSASGEMTDNTKEIRRRLN